MRTHARKYSKDSHAIDHNVQQLRIFLDVVPPKPDSNWSALKNSLDKIVSLSKISNLIYQILELVCQGTS